MLCCLYRYRAWAIRSFFISTSWVQAQLQDHPDELWEDGVQEYLNRAKNIMEKFSDVVNWLKANAAKGESHGGLRSNDAKTKPAFGIDESSQKVVLVSSIFCSYNTKLWKLAFW